MKKMDVNVKNEIVNSTIEKTLSDNYYIPEMNNMPYIENGQLAATTSHTTAAVSGTSTNNETNMDNLTLISSSCPMYNDSFAPYYYYLQS